MNGNNRLPVIGSRRTGQYPRKLVDISTLLAGQKLGIKEVDDGIWLASLMRHDLGYFDLEQKTPQPLDNPFGTRLSPMSQVRSVAHVSGPDTHDLLAERVSVNPH